MLMRLVLAIAVGIIAMLICLLLGLILVELKIDVVTTIGKFLTQWAVVIGVVCGLVQFVSGRLSWPV